MSVRTKQYPALLRHLGRYVAGGQSTTLQPTSSAQNRAVCRLVVAIACSSAAIGARGSLKDKAPLDANRAKYPEIRDYACTELGKLGIT